MSNKFKWDRVRSMHFLYKLTSNILVNRNAFQTLNSYLLKRCATKRWRLCKSVNYTPVWIVQTDNNNLQVYQVRPLLELAELNRQLLQTMRPAQPDWHILIFIIILNVVPSEFPRRVWCSPFPHYRQLSQSSLYPASFLVCYRQIDWNWNEVEHMLC